MPNFPVRNLGGAGVISDVFPCDLPPNVFSAGVNVRFDNGGVSRGPVMREVNDLTAYDAAYLLLAATLQAPLLTFDQRLSQAAQRHLSGGERS